MEQRHMQEKSRGAARPDVDARARAIQEQIIHIPRPAQPGNARPAAQRMAGHPSGSIHLNNEGYNVWREFLVTHTAYSKENPYLPGSPYYTAPAA